MLPAITALITADLEELNIASWLTCLHFPTAVQAPPGGVLPPERKTHDHAPLTKSTLSHTAQPADISQCNGRSAQLQGVDIVRAVRAVVRALHWEKKSVRWQCRQPSLPDCCFSVQCSLAVTSASADDVAMRIYHFVITCGCSKLLHSKPPHLSIHRLFSPRWSHSGTPKP